MPQEDEKKNDGDSMKKLKSERVERLSAKIHALFWVVLAVCVAVYTNIFEKALTDQRVER